MQPDYWYKQTVAKPLYPELLWSRPENRKHAGKLLIVGGHAQSFAAPAQAFSKAGKAGIGTARYVRLVILDAITAPQLPATLYDCNSHMVAFPGPSIWEFQVLAGQRPG